MASLPSPHAHDFLHELAAARAGSVDALGQLLMDYRNYLLLVADQKLEPDLRGKVSPSDLVQETFLEAQRDFRQFVGDRADELLAWLCCILGHNMANTRRRYFGTDKRDLKREIPLYEYHEEDDSEDELTQDTPTPSERAEASEEAIALEQALTALPDHYQRVLRLRYQEQRTFTDIGVALNCSSEAARKMWARAVDQLYKTLSAPHEAAR